MLHAITLVRETQAHRVLSQDDRRNAEERILNKIKILHLFIVRSKFIYWRPDSALFSQKYHLEARGSEAQPGRLGPHPQILIKSHLLSILSSQMSASSRSKRNSKAQVLFEGGDITSKTAKSSTELATRRRKAAAAQKTCQS